MRLRTLGGVLLLALNAGAAAAQAPAPATYTVTLMSPELALRMAEEEVGQDGDKKNE